MVDTYCHESSGTVHYDPGQGTRHFEPWFAMLLCDDGILDYLSWFMKRAGMPVQTGFRWGAHITFIRGEEPPNKEAWGKYAAEEVAFSYGQEIHWSNGWHAWVEVWCPRLTEIRQELGLTSHPQ